MKARTKQALLGLTAIALVGVAGIAGTFAYLQDTSNDVVNTFSPNKVTVELFEHDSKGEEVAKRDDYNIVPGTSQAKDPTVRVNATVDSYVFVKVTDESDGVIDYTIDSENWTVLDIVKYPGVYYCEVDGPVDGKEISVLEGNQVSYPATLTNEDMVDADGNLREDITLTFTAYAIQQVKGTNAEGVEDFTPEDAWLQIPMTASTSEELKDSLGENKITQLKADINFPEAKKDEKGYTIPEVIDVPDGAIIDLNDYTMEVPFMAAVFQGDSFTIRGGTVTSDANYALWIGDEVKSDTVLVEDVKVVGGINIYDAHNVTLRNVTVDASKKEYYAVWADYNAQVVIESGTYIGGKNPQGKDMPAVNAFTSDNTKLVIKGGTFNTNKNLEQYVAEGYQIVEEEVDGVTWYTVVESGSVSD